MAQPCYVSGGIKLLLSIAINLQQLFNCIYNYLYILKSIYRKRPNMGETCTGIILTHVKEFKLKIMEDYKERPIVEQKELKEKFIKLVEFINSDKFYELSTNNKQLLKNLKIAMELYLAILNMRVYEDVDKITVPDLGIICMMSDVFGGNGLFKTSDSNISYLENKLKEDTKD